MSPTVEERRLMTVWFAEISGFADLVARTDLEDLQEINQAVLSFFDRVVTREGGVVHKYDSGRAIALFGFPHSHEDDPELVRLIGPDHATDVFSAQTNHPAITEWHE